KSSGTLRYSSRRILGTCGCAPAPDSEPFPPALFFMVVSLPGDYSTMPPGSPYLPVIATYSPSALNLVRLNRLGCLGSCHPSIQLIQVNHSLSIPDSFPLLWFTPELRDFRPPPLRNSTLLGSTHSDALAPFPRHQQSFAWVVPLFIHGCILSGRFQPFPLDLLPTPETPLWLRFRMPQFLSHGFSNPPPGSFLVSFMAASSVAAFLPFPPDLVPTSGLRPPDSSVLPLVQPLGLIGLLPELPWMIHECIPIRPYCSSAFQALPSDS
ncbi:hypothetical protein B0H14DRAFT_3777712, partial [Mycena olivaceomarginata]